jgi:hypothetical protein
MKGLTVLRDVLEVCVAYLATGDRRAPAVLDIIMRAVQLVAHILCCMMLITATHLICSKCFMTCARDWVLVLLLLARNKWISMSLKYYHTEVHKVL